MSKIKDYYLNKKFDDSKYTNYTPWRKFLAWVGLISLIIGPVYIIWSMLSINNLVDACL